MKLTEEISRIKEMMYVISEDTHTATIPVRPDIPDNLKNLLEIEFFVDAQSKGKMKCGENQSFEVSKGVITVTIKTSLACESNAIKMTVDASSMVWNQGGGTTVVSKLSSDSVSKLSSAGVLINGSSPDQYQTSVTISELSKNPTLQAITITMGQQQSGGQQQGGTQGKSGSGTIYYRMIPPDWLLSKENYKCVWNHPNAIPVKFNDKTTAFIIGEYVYYNNGRRHKNESGSSMENYTCADVENSTKTTEDSTNQSLPEPKDVNMQYKDEKGTDKNYRYLKRGSDWFARNIKRNGSVFNLSKKSRDNNDKYQSSINNLENAVSNKDGKRLEKDSNTN